MATKKGTLQSTLTALQKAEAHVKQLRQKASAERAGQLKDLHVSFGFASRRDLIDALAALEGPRAAGAVAGSSDTSGAGRGTRRRARITPELRAEVIKAIKAGDRGLAIAKRFSISNQSVQNIKKAAGLVQSRKKKAK
jgi:hypothetical protein